MTKLVVLVVTGMGLIAERMSKGVKGLKGVGSGDRESDGAALEGLPPSRPMAGGWWESVTC